MLRKFIEETPAIVSSIILPVILWSIIFVIEYLVGYFMSPIMIGAVSAISGVVIGSYINRVKNSQKYMEKRNLMNWVFKIENTHLIRWGF